jgi:hypothetical protein
VHEKTPDLGPSAHKTAQIEGFSFEASFPDEKRLLRRACAKKPLIWAVSAHETAQIEGFSFQQMFLSANVYLRPFPSFVF